MGVFADRLLAEFASVPGDIHNRVVEDGFNEGIQPRKLQEVARKAMGVFLAVEGIYLETRWF